jgi:hypothetical protein
MLPRLHRHAVKTFTCGHAIPHNLTHPSKNHLVSKVPGRQTLPLSVLSAFDPIVKAAETSFADLFAQAIVPLDTATAHSVATYTPSKQTCRPIYASRKQEPVLGVGFRHSSPLAPSPGAGQQQQGVARVRL